MSGQESWHDELNDLCRLAIDQQLSEEQRARLEQIVLGDRRARQIYVEYLHEHACLAWSFGDLAGLPQPPLAAAPGAAPGRGHTAKACAAAPPHRAKRAWQLAMPYAATVVATLIVGVWAGWVATRRPAMPVVGQLVDAKGCTWSGASLPTELGADLTAGRLRLAEGVARLRLTVGAEIALEGPADLELLSRQRCILHSGRLVANVFNPAADFVIETQTSVLKHQGTEFGVHVEESGLAEVEVFDGAVDVQNKLSGKTLQVSQGKLLRMDRAEAVEYAAGGEWPRSRSPRMQVSDPSLEIMQISTATGRGRDASVQSNDSPERRRQRTLLVKNILPDDAKFQRKAYLAFDLSSLRDHTVVEARLDLTLVPSGVGFVSRFPDATFAVYGLIDQTVGDWDEASLTWASAPANRPGGAALDPKKVVLLGRFVLERGVQRGTFGVAGAELVQFLNRDASGMATLILVRETIGPSENSLIHSFASRYHPTLPPPTLKLTVRSDSPED